MKLLPRLEDESAVAYLNKMRNPPPMEKPRWWQLPLIYNLYKERVKASNRIENLLLYLDDTHLQLKGVNKELTTCKQELHTLRSKNAK